MSELNESMEYKQKKIMIVEDDKFSSMILKNFCEKLGLEVVYIAENGVRAYEKYVEVC